MRCICRELSDDANREELEAYRRRANEFWVWVFGDVGASGEHKPRPQQVSARLQHIDPGLFIHHIDLRNTWVVSAYEASDRPRVELFVTSVPPARAEHVVVGLPPRSLAAVAADVPERDRLRLDGARFRAGFARGHLIELTIYFPGAGSTNDAGAQRAAEQLVEGLLGERVYDDWIGAVRVAPLVGAGPLRVVSSSQSETYPLEQLCPVVDSAIDGLHRGLSDRPCHERRLEADWTVFELAPSPGSDWPAQDDLALATTCLPEMLSCYLRGAPFCSKRFSRHGERFGFVKFDSRTPHDAERLRQRQAVEDVLDERLRASAAGCVVGNGLGVRYSYVDLALSDVARAASILRETAASLALPNSSWLLFCDDEWSSQWIGAFEQSPEPCLRVEP